MRQSTPAVVAVVLVMAIAGNAGATAFTRTSPTANGLVPAGVTEVGGVVLDLIGLNDVRVISQLPASSLFDGFFDTGSPTSYRGNPGTIGIQTGFNSTVTGALGGGLKEAAVRVTLYDGDTGPGNFDDNQNWLRLNTYTMQNFSSVVTERTSSNGLTHVSWNYGGGFRNNLLDTGWFHSNDSTFCSNLYASIVGSEQVVFQLYDSDAYDNYFDFTQGVDGGLIDVGQGPTVDVIPEPLTMTLMFLSLGGVGFQTLRRRRS